ncbi:PLASTID MOVEMENT IMPAIRED PROTEIN [Salix koriyanagi]|uniref:PLASTID MOVEMENT IMPAIRED PROTEIN n=1 Tax=Salix koriyanagi TaxID=2511006 RepID=A0A9Q0UY22_9ROSI|nr:PLASTID MOVEMENT IMPAIRED PROTEIN [Salix koriyanagi]
MGNNLGGGKTAEVMKINGETFKLRTPARVTDVVKDYPGFVLLDSEAVKHFGIRAKPLEPQQELKAKKIYFLIELPEIPEEKEARSTRRVRSAIQMSAKDRLENLMLSRRSVSDLSMVRPSPSQTSDGTGAGPGES